jgi:hypothetical protein
MNHGDANGSKSATPAIAVATHRRRRAPIAPSARTSGRRRCVGVKVTPCTRSAR